MQPLATTARRQIAVIVVSLVLGTAVLARADSTREYAVPTPARAPAAPSLEAAQKLVDAGDYRGAIPMLTAVVQKDPNNADALNLMGYSLRKTGQTDLALQYYDRALSLMPKHLGANEYLGELYVELGQMDKAKERLSVLRAACGNCQQEKDLAGAIEKGPGTKTRGW